MSGVTASVHGRSYRADGLGAGVEIASLTPHVKGNRFMGIPASLQATPLPAPYQLAIEPVAFQLTILDGSTGGSAAREVHRETCVRPPMWFSVTLREPLEKRFVYLVQHETDTGRIVLILLFDREAAGASLDLRLPPSGTWLRAVVDGGVYALASDLVLSRKSITAWLGGDEPPTTMPPYT